MGNNLIKRGKNPCSLFDKYYFGGEYLVRTSIRMMMLIFSYSWFGILGGIVGFFIPILIISIQRLLIAFYLDFEGFANFHGHAHCQVQDPALTLRADHQPEQY